MQPTTNPQPNDNTFSPFLPLLMLAASLTLVLAWNTVIAAQQWNAGYRLEIQQDLALNQAVQAEEKMKALMLDLVVLAKHDESAQAIVKKYNITFNPPAAQTPAPAPAP